MVAPRRLPNWFRTLLTLIPIGSLVLFAYNMLHTNLRVWVLTDVVIITFAGGLLLRNVFVYLIERANRKVELVWGERPLGRWWQFTGYLYGILIAGLVGMVFSDVEKVTTPSVESTVVLTGEAIAIVILSFVSKFIPEHRKFTIKLRWQKFGLRAWWSRRRLKPQKKARWAGIILIAILIVPTLAYIWALQNDYYGLPFGLNPKPNVQIAPIELDYPPSGFSYTFSPRIVSLFFWLASNGTIAQGTEVVSVSKGVTNAFPIEWRRAVVTFDEAFVYPPNPNHYVATGLPVASFGTTPDGEHVGLGGNFTFYWPTAGDFSPTLTITLANGTVRVYTYSDIKVPVVSSIDIQNAKNAKVQTALTYVLVAFVFVEGFSIIWELTEDKKTQSPAIPQPTPSATNPPQTSTSPTN